MFIVAARQADASCVVASHGVVGIGIGSCQQQAAIGIGVIGVEAVGYGVKFVSVELLRLAQGQCAGGFGRTLPADVTYGEGILRRLG